MKKNIVECNSKGIASGQASLPPATANALSGQALADSGQGQASLGDGLNGEINLLLLASGPESEDADVLQMLLRRFAKEAADESVPKLAAYAGGKTSGVLVREDGSSVDLLSGYNGPSATLPKPRPGMNGRIVSHVEAHAAAVMRNEGLKDATLWINRAPCGGSSGCMVNLSRMVPTGSTMTIYVMPGGSSGAFEDMIIVTGTG